MAVPAHAGDDADDGGAPPMAPLRRRRGCRRRTAADDGRRRRAGDREVADRRHLLSIAGAGRASRSSSVGDTVQQGPGALHHRSDEADERDRLRVRRRDRRASTSRTARPCSTASGCSRSRRFATNHVQKNPDRQSRRDRAARDLRVPRAGHQDRRRLFGGRRELAARPVCGRGRLHRPGAQRRQLPERAGDHQRRRDHRRRRDPSRLRIPVRERLSRRSVRGVPHPVHRARSAA